MKHTKFIKIIKDTKFLDNYKMGFTEKNPKEDAHIFLDGEIEEEFKSRGQRKKQFYIQPISSHFSLEESGLYDIINDYDNPDMSRDWYENFLITFEDNNNFYITLRQEGVGGPITEGYEFYEWHGIDDDDEDYDDLIEDAIKDFVYGRTVDYGHIVQVPNSITEEDLKHQLDKILKNNKKVFNKIQTQINEILEEELKQKQKLENEKQKHILEKYKSQFNTYLKFHNWLKENNYQTPTEELFIQFIQ